MEQGLQRALAVSELHRETLRWNPRMLLRGAKSASAHVLQTTTSVWCLVPATCPSHRTKLPSKWLNELETLFDFSLCRQKD